MEEKKMGKIDLDKFMAKEKVIEIDGTEFKIKALSVEDLPLLAGGDDPEKAPEVSKNIIEKILKDTFPDITQEQINNFSFKYITPLMDAFGKVNNMAEQDVSKLKNRLKELKK
jgi:hypothetical protein